jgi:hypothetical protein
VIKLRVEPIAYAISTPAVIPYTSDANTDQVTHWLLTDLQSIKLP